MASGSRRNLEVKVVLIDTQYVVTDPRNFKSVVQGLTGKDSSVAWIDERGFTGASSSGGRNIIPDVVGDISEKCGGTTSSKVNARGEIDSLRLSFKDLDQMIIELPMDEWNDLWGPMHA